MYARKAADESAPLVFCDLRDSDLSGWGITEDQATRRIHARLPDGQIVSGQPAFVALWSGLRGWRWLAWGVNLPGLRAASALAYDKVAAPLLYRMHLRRQRRAD